ncbi:MAG: hypothetical protein R3C56_19630 [Pirellulaceae bacterium]
MKAPRLEQIDDAFGGRLRRDAPLVFAAVAGTTPAVPRAAAEIAPRLKPADFKNKRRLLIMLASIGFTLYSLVRASSSVQQDRGSGGHSGELLRLDTRLGRWVSDLRQLLRCSGWLA